MSMYLNTFRYNHTRVQELWHLGISRVDSVTPKLHALVYDNLPSTTAVFGYATGSRKLSANKLFFLGAKQ